MHAAGGDEVQAAIAADVKDNRVVVYMKGREQVRGIPARMSLDALVPGLTHPFFNALQVSLPVCSIHTPERAPTPKRMID